MATVDVALVARIQAEPGKEQDVAELLKGALPHTAESAATGWFALKLGPSTFGIFDAVSASSNRSPAGSPDAALSESADAQTRLPAPGDSPGH